MTELMEKALTAMCDYLQSLIQGNCTGISYVDSTSIAVCDNHRITRNKVFADIAQRGKTSMELFYGFKLYAIINDKGELTNVTVTQGYLSKYLANWLSKNLDL